MALNRDEILGLDLNEGLVEEYLVESMKHQHQATVATKRLKAALDAIDELHAELAVLRAPAQEGEAPGPDPRDDVLQEAEQDPELTAQ